MLSSLSDVTRFGLISEVTGFGNKRLGLIGLKVWPDLMGIVTVPGQTDEAAEESLI